MMASPGEIANDMAAHAAYWYGRDRDIGRACRDAAGTLHGLMAGERVDGRTYADLQGRLLNLADAGAAEDWHIKGYPDFDRAAACIERLYREAA